MTKPNDRVDQVIDAFLDYLEGQRDEPTLDHLTDDERAEARRLIASIRSGRGLDPYSSPPSLDSVLAGTPFEGSLERDLPIDDDVLDLVRSELGAYASVVRDVDASERGLAGDFVLRVEGQRLRVVVVAASTALTADRAVASAHALFGAFPDTCGVLLVHPNAEMSSIAIDPFDAAECIVVPSGMVERPRARRPVLPLADSLRLYMEFIAPDLSDSSGPLERRELDAAELARAAAKRSVEAIAADGRRARIPAKKEAWGSFGDAQTTALAALVLGLINNPESADTIEDGIEALAVA
jgi:hypothetical protein